MIKYINKYLVRNELASHDLVAGDYRGDHPCL